MTVFDIDGETWGPRLKAWAEVCAAEKAAERGDVERIIWWRGKKDVLRGLPELEVPDPDPEPDLEDDEPDFEEPPEFDPDEYERLVDEAVEREQERRKGLVVTAKLHPAERERRKESARQKDRERVARRKARGRGGGGERTPDAAAPTDAGS